MPMRPDQLERRLRERLDALGPAARTELLHVLMLPDFDRVDRIGGGGLTPDFRAVCRALHTAHDEELRQIGEGFDGYNGDLPKEGADVDKSWRTVINRGHELRHTPAS
jgi:hypothetical protein